MELAILITIAWPQIAFPLLCGMTARRCVAAGSSGSDLGSLVAETAATSPFSPLLLMAARCPFLDAHVTWPPLHVAAVALVPPVGRDDNFIYEKRFVLVFAGKVSNLLPNFSIFVYTVF